MTVVIEPRRIRKAIKRSNSAENKLNATAYNAFGWIPAVLGMWPRRQCPTKVEVTAAGIDGY
jgi:hypothetical protein